MTVDQLLSRGDLYALLAGILSRNTTEYLIAKHRDEIPAVQTRIGCRLYRPEAIGFLLERAKELRPYRDCRRVETAS